MMIIMTNNDTVQSTLEKGDKTSLANFTYLFCTFESFVEYVSEKYMFGIVYIYDVQLITLFAKFWHCLQLYTHDVRL